MLLASLVSGLNGCSPHDDLSSLGSALTPPTLEQNSTALETPASVAHEGTLFHLAPTPLTWVETQEVWANDTPGWELFGNAIALDGDLALVGAWAATGALPESGAAYLFARSAATWSQIHEFVASDGAQYDEFGLSVALSGDHALVGARYAQSFGAAYLYVRNAATWPATETQRLYASDASAWAQFGRSVALSGERALVGAPDDAQSGVGSGAAYIFIRNASVWLPEQKLLPSQAGEGDDFGHAVALDGDLALVGARYNLVGPADDGAAYLFGRGTGSWAEQQRVIPSDVDGQQMEFGTSVALDGDTALVGAPFSHVVNGVLQGGAYLFSRSASTWPGTEAHKFVASDGAHGQQLGRHVALRGDTALMGAPIAGGAASKTGAAYLFQRSATLWPATETQKLVASDGAKDDAFGAAVAIGADVALVGAASGDGVAFESGTVYMFSLRKTIGQACGASSDCASLFCVDGRCCESACTGGCGACDVAGLEGVCSPVVAGTPPESSCAGHLCNGDLASCPTSCSGDADCVAGNYCDSAKRCVPKLVDGTSCQEGRACSSGHCVDGGCCDEACEGGCASCKVAGGEGRCQARLRGAPGEASCRPYLCSGEEKSCSSSCSESGDCAEGHHCEEGACRPLGEAGAGCEAASACDSGHCVDEVCCLDASCGAYRCGAAGACELACQSRSQCADGHGCTSEQRCEPINPPATDLAAPGGCTLAPRPTDPRSDDWGTWLLGLVGLVGLLGLSGRVAARRRGHRP